MLPWHQGQKELGTRQLVPGMRASTCPQEGKGPRTSPGVDLQLSQQHRHLATGTGPPLSLKKVPESNKNLFLKISESKGHQPNNVNIKRKSCLQTCRRRPVLPAETKAPSVTSSSRLKSTLAFCFGQLSKPQEHPRAAKMTTKPRDTVSK